MFHTKYYLNIKNDEYNINDNEIIIIQSLLNSDYFKDLIPFNQNTYVKHINYNTANPSVTQPYSNNIPLSEQYKISAPETFEVNDECIKDTQEVVGNMRSFWRQIFPKTTKETIVRNTVWCTYYPLIYILQERIKEPMSVDKIKRFLLAAYKTYLGVFKDKIVNILKRQGKKRLLEPFERKQIEFDEVIHSDDYYLTALDFWVIAYFYKVPIILFSSTKLKNLVAAIDWLVLGGNPLTDKYYFIRNTGDLVLNQIPAYNIIKQSFLLSELKQFFELIEEAVIRANPEYSTNVQSLETYFATQPLVIKR